MERESDERTGLDALADATGPVEVPAIPPDDEESRAEETSEEERSAVNSASSTAATHRAWGGQTPGAAAGVGTRVPPEGEKDVPEGAKDSTDPRGL